MKGVESYTRTTTHYVNIQFMIMFSTDETNFHTIVDNLNVLIIPTNTNRDKVIQQ